MIVKIITFPPDSVLQGVDVSILQAISREMLGSPPPQVLIFYFMYFRFEMGGPTT